jgi:class 3 adenylate cyclase
MEDLPLDPSPGGRVRVGVWVLHLALPVLALWLLIAQPDLDVRWEHHPSHFWLVLGVATISLVLAVSVLRAAGVRSDARLVLIGYAFSVAAGSLFLHALATPGVIVSSANTGFEIATPVGLALASLFFVASSIELPPRGASMVLRADPAIRWILVVVMVAWAALSLAELPPLADPITESAEGPLRWVAVAAIALYLVAAGRFFASHRRKPSVMLVALITAAALLAEAMGTIVWARNWQLSWWLWHILMAAAFGFVAYSAYVEYRREGGAAGLFDGVVSRYTASNLRSEYGGALETLTSTLERSSTSGVTDQELDLIAAGLRARFGLTEGQTDVLARAARSLASERNQARRLGALALIGTETRVERSEDELFAHIVEVVRDRFSPDVMRIGLIEADGLSYPARLITDMWPDDGDRLTADIVVDDQPVAVIEFARTVDTFRSRDRAIIDTLAAEVGIALANVRLYQQLDGLFRIYLSPDVADTLRDDPSRAGLGGSVVALTALFADLRGFTSFTERTDPLEVTEMLNRYFSAAVPIILGNGGTVVQFVGDALLAVFDAPRPRRDHAYRAARSALAMQEAVETLAGQEAGWPRFRIGVNTGLALIGNVGSAEFRSFSVIGDAINSAARLEAAAEPGTVVIGEATHTEIADRVETTPLGALSVKGREQPIVAYRLDRLRPQSGTRVVPQEGTSRTAQNE